MNKASSEIIRAIYADDEVVLKEFYLANFRKVEAFVLRNGGHSADAEDIFQEAYMIVWRKVKEGMLLREEDTSIHGYLYKIARNKWVDHTRSPRYKRGHKMPEEEVFPPSDTAENEGEADLKISLIEGCLRELEETCRGLLDGFYYRKEKLQEIAQKHGWTVATAKNNKYRCLEKLRKIIRSKTR